MDTKIFMQDENIEETLDNWKKRSVHSKCDEIVIEGYPRVLSDGSQVWLKITLRIEKLERCQILHPEAPVDQRPVMGHCGLDVLSGAKCSYRKTTGECTSNPEYDTTEENCRYKSDATYKPKVVVYGACKSIDPCDAKDKDGNCTSANGYDCPSMEKLSDKLCSTKSHQ